MSKVWYYSENLKPQGPMTLAEMRERIHQGKIGPEDLICDESTDGGWLPAKEFRCFEATLFPAMQGYVQGADLNLHSADWVILSPEGESGPLRQFGPYTHEEVVELLRQGDVLPNCHIWKSGLSGWSKLTDRPEFKEFILPSL